MRIVLVGPPGVGKGTQSQRLVAQLGVPHISTGEMIRQAMAAKTEIGRQCEQFMATGNLVPDEIALRLIELRLRQPDCQRGYVLDGFPRTVAQAIAFDQQLATTGTPLSLVLELVVDKEHLLERLAARQRVDDRPELIRARLDNYFQLTAPLTDYYRQQGLLRTIDGTGAPDDVFARIRQVIGN